MRCFCQAIKRALSLYLLLLPLAASAEQITNGNFEAFSGGIPVGWTYTRGDGPASLESSAFTSPFTGVYPAGTRSVLLTDGTSTSLGPELQTLFPSVSGAFTLSFDFRLGGALTPDAWVFLPLATAGVVPFDLFIDSGGFRATDTFTQRTILSLSQSVWYHVQASGSTASGKYSGSITPFGGVARTWNNYNFTGPITELVGVSIGDDAATATANTPTYFDNVSAVPEPSVSALLVFGAGVLFVVRRIKKI